VPEEKQTDQETEESENSAINALNKDVNDNVMATLKHPSLRFLVDALASEVEIAAADYELRIKAIAHSLTGMPATEALLKVDMAMTACMDAGENPFQAFSEEGFRRIRKLVGWLVLLTVDLASPSGRDGLNAMKAGTLRIDIAAETKLGVEVLVAYLFKNAAQLRIDPNEKFSLNSGYGHGIGDLTINVDPDDRLRYLLTNLYKELHILDPKEQDLKALAVHLNTTIKIRKTVHKENHYLLIEKNGSFSEEGLRGLLQRLDYHMNNLATITFDTSGRVLKISEPELAAYLFDIFRKIPS